jgi:RNA polymerase sigma factor (sigma-70 family)
VREREDDWTDLMRSAISGDGAAYHRLLKAVTPVLRAAARRGLARAGQPVDQSEDIVQDILLAVHLKRHTWDANAPFAPWLFAIARNKLIDALRRRGKRVFVNIDDFAETLPGGAAEQTAAAGEVAAQLRCCPRASVRCCSRSRSSASIKDTAAKYSMSEGAVRVALHQGLMHNPFFDLKFAVTIALAISAIAVSLHLSRPEASLRGFGWWLLIPAGLLAAGVGGEMMMPQRVPMMTRLVGSNSKICMTAVPAMALPLLAGALIGLRHGAPSRPAVAGAIAGLLSSGLAATVYAAHCTDDSPLFVATWYTLAAALMAAIGALAGSRMLRF